MKRVYLIGIGGIAMANLACVLKKKGYIISGSDIGIFGPSAVLLKTNKINYFKDHDPNHIKKFKPDIIVIGNAIKRGNSSLEHVITNNIPYCSMPEIIKTELLKNKKSIVITGTSGKTTTTALVAWILYKSGFKPTALIGGTVKNLNQGYLVGNGNYFVIEGDEYSSSFEDSSPKFTHYEPYICAVNNIRPDHLDIYGSFEEIIKTFKKLPPLISKDGLLILNSEDKNSLSLKNLSISRVETFGDKGELKAENIKAGTLGLEFDLSYKNKNLGKIKTSLLGRHNVENILSASIIAINVGVSFSKLAKAIKTFNGVKRRLEIIYQKKNITIIDDFAHNPDKVRASLAALRYHHTNHKIIAIFEPRTASSRRKFFQKTYIDSFNLADFVYISEPYNKKILSNKDVFSNNQLADSLNKKRIKTYALKNADSIVAHLKNNILKNNNSPIIICVMTSGEFDNIHQKLISLFK